MKTSILAVAAALAVTLAAGSAYAQGDAEAGKNEFKKCMACHAVGEGATNRVGPVLNDVFGRVAGTYEGYKYSKAMVDAGAAGLIWTPETMAEFLYKPKDFVPGTDPRPPADRRADAAHARADDLEARSMIDRELIAALQADGVLHQKHVAELQAALTSSRTIGAALGILMASRNLTQEEALVVLKETSQRTNTKLRDLAQTLVGETSAGR